VAENLGDLQFDLREDAASLCQHVRGESDRSVGDLRRLLRGLAQLHQHFLLVLVRVHGRRGLRRLPR
jgi:hypothetical protein